MIQKFSCKYCVHKYLNLSHFFPLQSCSSFSVVLVEELPTSESKSCSVHGDQPIKAVCCFLSQICLSRSKQNFKFSGLPCSHHHQQSPGFILQPCSLPSSASCTEESGSIFRDEDTKKSSLSPPVSPPLLLFLSLPIYRFLSSCCLLEIICSVTNVLAVCSKSF